ncbi:MAG: type II toxin-antitoxin system RelE/ParE family toxin [Candidatus Hydrogenedentes bacterium]|nr:type II toxin-antitoxin system RelE/ParE family toxin [Candidatus Hydrogenedentota bacterium]
MKYTLRLKPKAEKELAQLASGVRQRIIEALEKLENGLAGDVKRLTSFTPEYRLRVGDYRALFEIEGNSIVVYRICPRKEAYRR